MAPPGRGRQGLAELGKKAKKAVRFSVISGKSHFSPKIQVKPLVKRPPPQSKKMARHHPSFHEGCRSVLRVCFIYINKSNHWRSSARGPAMGLRNKLLRICAGALRLLVVAVAGHACSPQMLEVSRHHWCQVLKAC